MLPKGAQRLVSVARIPTEEVDPYMAFKYDLLLTGGEVVDPSQNLHGIRDVAFVDGKVAAVDSNLRGDDAREIVDVSGKIVTPGLIDIHGHYFEHIVPFSIGADSVCLPNGVTSTVDAGSSGWTHFDGFREYIVEREQTRLFALVNLSALGMLHQYRHGGFGPTVVISGGPQTLLPAECAGELMDLRFAQVEECVTCIKDNPNIALGVKIRLDIDISGRENVKTILERARQVAELTDSFIMVHVAGSPVPLAAIFDELRPGDIVTHIFHSTEHNVLDEKGRVRTEVREAQSKGIVFDIGAGYFGKEISRAAIEQRVLPATISTDITKKSFYERVHPDQETVIFTLPEVMTPYMALGMSLDEVVAATTCNAAAAIGQEGALGTLRVGALGDAAVLNLERGAFETTDTDGVPIECDQQINAFMTIKDGKVWKPARESTPAPHARPWRRV